jgi:tetratricopeptide (TPR) repeat protein
MRLRSLFIRVILLSASLLCLNAVAEAQRGLRGQILLPNGAPVQKVTRFTLASLNGLRNEIYFTDSNGRITISPPPTGKYNIIVDSDGETYGTTILSFDSVSSGNYISINLMPLSPKPPGVIGMVNINDVDKQVSLKAKEAFSAALNFIKAGEYEQAIEPLKQAISLEKKYFQAHNDLGVVYMKLNRLSEAEQTLRQAIKINDQPYLPQLNLGLVLNKQRKYKEAAEVLAKLQQRNPDLRSVHVPLIEALFNSQSWVEAEVEIKKALTVTDLDEVDLKIKLGIVELRLAKYEAAITTLREATKAEPNNALAQFNLGAALSQTNKLDEAEQALLRAYEIKGAAMPGAQLMLGQIYFQKKIFDKAIEAFETYLRDLPAAPNAEQVKDAIARLRQLTRKP